MPAPSPEGGNVMMDMVDKKPNVILIKPMNSDVVYDPKKIGELIRNAPFKDHVIDSRPNKKLGLIAVEIKEDFDVTGIEEITLVKGIEIECTVKKADAIVRYGVIHPLSLEADLEEIKTLITPRGSNAGSVGKVLAIERLKRRAGAIRVDSLSVKITFEGNILPEAISIEWSHYKVSPYVQPPLQCFKCQRMGHVAARCNSQTRCMLCSGNHNRTDCTVDPAEHKCANCKGEHRANDPICPHYKQAKEVEVLRSTQKERMNYHQAKKILSQKEVNPTYDPPRGSYAHILSNTPPIEPVPSTSASLPTPVKEALNPNEPIYSLNELKESLKSCLLSILAEILPENPKKDDFANIVAQKVNSHFSKRRMSDSSSGESPQLPKEKKDDSKNKKLKIDQKKSESFSASESSKKGAIHKNKSGVKSSGNSHSRK